MPRSLLILSPAALWLPASVVLLAVAVLWLSASRQRQQRAVTRLSDQVARLVEDETQAGRIQLEDPAASLRPLESSINRLLEALEMRGARLQDREQMFQRLVESVHEAVVVHRNGVLFANSRFLSLLSMREDEIVGRPLSNFVTAEYRGPAHTGGDAVIKICAGAWPASRPPSAMRWNCRVRRAT